MHFTILIPTYRRPQNVDQTIRSLFVLLKDAKFEWEIVVSNNPPPAPEGRYPIETVDPRVRVVESDKHLPSAEENFRFGMDHCKGEYVWLLGDDDALLPYGMECMIENLERADFDLLIMGARMTKYNGELSQNTRQATHQMQYDMPLLDYVRKTGFWFVMAAFSTNIFRRSMLDLELFDQMIETSKIYSHSTVLIGSFHDKKFRFLNAALVDYRQNRHDAVDTGHWSKAAKAQGVKNKDFWLTGFMKLLKILIERNVFEARYLAEVIDLSISDRFRFIDHLIIQLLQQLELGFKNNSEKFQENEFKFVISFLEEVAPEYYDYWMMVRSIYHNDYAKPHTSTLEALNDLFFDSLKPSMHFLDRFIIGTSGKYTLARHDNLFVAFDNNKSKKVKEIIQYFDFYEVPGTVLISNSREDLENKIIEEHKIIGKKYLEGAGGAMIIGEGLEMGSEVPLENSMELKTLVAILAAIKGLVPRGFKRWMGGWVRRKLAS